jgi:hypothetical protein
MKKTAFILLLFTWVFSSCEKVIDLDLKTSETKYVLRGNVLAGDILHTLSITTSLPFDELNNFPVITNANVTLSDDLGNSTSMIYDPSLELYIATNYPAYEGRTYTMSVEIDGQTFESTCSLPFLVPFLDVESEKTSFFGQEGYILTPKFQDPAQYKNYYKLRFYEKDSLENDSRVLIANDDLTNGQMNQRPYFGSFFPQIGDTIIYELWGIDATAYTYLFSKETNTSATSGAPANPISNWSNDALGYFSVHNFQQIQFVIQ